MTASQCPAAELAANFDFSDPRVRADRIAVYEELRNGPPKWSDAFDGHWVMARYADLNEMLMHPERFCSSGGTTIPPTGFPVRLPPNEVDPPVHSQWRKLGAPYFKPESMDRLEDVIRTVTRERLAGFVGAGRADLTKDLVLHVPANVIADMMGFPRSDAQWFSEISDRLLETAERLDLAEENAATGEEFVGYLSKHLEARRTHPQDDLLTSLVEGTVDGRPLTPEELLGISFFFLIAGHETTVGGLTFMLWRLGTNPDQRAKLVADPTLIPVAIEEALRLDSPVLHLARTVVTDTDLGGAQMKAGDKVMALFAAANLDEEMFSDPLSFQVDRPNCKRHLAFSTGIHKCQGAPLARLEMRVVVEEVLNVIPDYRVEDGVAFRSLQGVHSVKSMPVTFTPVPDSELVPLTSSPT